MNNIGMSIRIEQFAFLRMLFYLSLWQSVTLKIENCKFRKIKRNKQNFRLLDSAKFYQVDFSQ